MLNKIVFLICFLLSSASKAAHLDSGVNTHSKNSECQKVFDHSSIKSLLNNKGLKPVETKDYHEYLNTTMLQSAFNRKVESKKQFPAAWKKDVLKNLFLLDTAQVLTLVENIKSLKINNAIISEGAFFQSLALEIAPIIPKFDKQGLIEVLYDFSYLKITMPDKFVRAWRKRALELKQDFTSFDRYFLSSFFRKLGISPLRDPYNLDSGYITLKVNLE